MIEVRPRLRDGISLRAQPDGTAALIDPLFARGIGLDAPTLAVVRVTDGTRTTAELLTAAAPHAPDASRDALEQSLRALYLLNMIEGAGPAIVAAAASLAAAGPLPTRVLPEARFACQSSGGCCQGYTFGPLSPSDVARLESLDLAGAFPHLAPPWVIDKKSKRYLPSIDDRCVFLRPDHLCGIHVAFGADAKPDFCKLYPVQAMATVAGLKLYDHGECASFSVSSVTGPLLSEEAPRLRAMLPAERLELYHPVVALGGGTYVDHGHFLRLQDALCAVVESQPGDAGQALRAVAALARAFITRVASCPLGAGEPDRTIDDVLAKPAWVQTAPASARAISRTTMVAGILLQSIQPKLDELARTPDRLAFELYQRFADTVTHLATPAPVTWGADVEAALRRSLRYQLFSHRALIDDSFLPALLRMAMVHLFALHGAKLAAMRAGRDVVALPDFDRAHVAALRVLRLPVPMGVLVAYQDDVWHALEAAPTMTAAVRS